MQRPLDVLGSSEGKNVLVHLKGAARIKGVLRAFDSHINLWLDNAEYLYIEPLADKKFELKLGKTLVRGDSIVLISPEK